MSEQPQKIYDFLYEGDGERLDVYLSRVQGYTRNFFHRLLGRGDIKVLAAEHTGDRAFDDPLWEIKKKSYQLKRGDRIHIVHPERYMESSMLAQAPAVPGVKIVLEKTDYVVVHKPAGVLSHPNSVWGIEYPSVVGALYHHFKQMPSISNFVRAGLVHRLDRETDGLMIVVKTEKGLKHFQRLFHAKSKAQTLEAKREVPLHKHYRATSYVLPKGYEFLQSLRDTDSRMEHFDHSVQMYANLPHLISMIVEPKIPFYEPKLGITQINTIQDVPAEQKGTRNRKTRDATLEAAKKRHAVDHKELEKYETVRVEMELFTGRTHQIRYHLSQYGLPIVGDYLYGGDDFYQMQLQAYKLVFEDPDGEHVELSINSS